MRGNRRKKILLLAILCCCLSWAGVMTAGAAKNVVKTAKVTSGGKWVRTSAGTQYQYKDGSYAKDAWLKISGSVYRISKKGYLCTGSFEVDKLYYYADDSGKLFTGKWLVKDGKKYFYLSSGARAKSQFVKIKGKYYFFKKDSTMASNQMITKNKKTYYVDKSGVRVKSMWVMKSGKRYYFNASGVRLNSVWVKSKGKYYYLGADGAMCVNQWIKDTYYVGADGARMTDCVIDGYYLDKNGKRSEKVSSGKYIFVGDSRTVGMGNAVSDKNTAFIAEVGQGYSWLVKTGGVKLRTMLAADPDVTVVLALGVNDLVNIKNYISYYTKLKKEFPMTSFYIMAVNPVDEKKEAAYGYKVKNSSIESFNREMLEAVGAVSFIDTYSYMKEKDFDSADGLHYTAKVYRDLYQYVLTQIK